MTDILIISMLLWLAGLFGQKSSEEDYRINTKSKAVLLLGIRPGSQPVYIKPAIAQAVAILMAMIGALISWLFPELGSAKAVAFNFGLISLGIATLVSLADLLFNRQ